jgi:hypothetical protein
MARETCLKCSEPLQQPATGRPPVYCSVGCRRATEYELRRLQRHLEAVEGELRAIRVGRSAWPEHRRKLESERKRLETRLAELLDTGLDLRQPA